MSLQASGSVVSAGRVQMAKEALPAQLLDLCGGVFPPRNYRCAIQLLKNKIKNNNCGYSI